MGNDVLVVAVHPDDETLGCGGTLLRHAANGDRIHWLIVTDMTSEFYSPDRIGKERMRLHVLHPNMGFHLLIDFVFLQHVWGIFPRIKLLTPSPNHSGESAHIPCISPF